MSEPQNYTELRHEVMRLADLITAKRNEVKAVITDIDVAITKLVVAADRLFTRAVAESDTEGKVRKFTYVNHDPSPEDIAAFTTPSSRHCGNCGEAGHTAPTCTNERKAEPEKPEKKKRVLSPERRAQLAEQLKGARAKRGKA